MRKFKRGILKKKNSKPKAGYVNQRLAEAHGFLQTGRLRDAEIACKDVLGRNPRHAGAFTMLASISLMSGNNRAALDFSRRAAAINPSDENNYINMGLASFNLNNHDEAISHYLAALNINNNNPLTHYNLGNAYKLKEDYQSAIEAYEAAVRLRPGYFKAYNNLGNAYKACGNPYKAVDCFKKTIELNPDIAEAHNNLGTGYVLLGELKKAENCFNTTLELQPGDHGALAGLAGIFEKKKDYARAYELVAPVLKKNTSGVNAPIATVYAVICSSMDKQNEAIEIITEVLEKTAYTPEEKRSLHFHLGRLYDEIKMYDKAFYHYFQANRLKNVQFSPEANLDKYKALIDTFHSDVSGTTSTNMSRLPIFIVGMPRSGTSLVEQILASHPQVHGAGELNDISLMVRSLPDLLSTVIKYPGCMDSVSTEQLDDLAEKYLEMLKSKTDNPQITRVTDKMPANFEHLGFIQRLLPKAVVIHCTRDPLDTCLSCYFQDFSGWLPYTYDLKKLGIAYRQYEHLMAFWRDVIQIPMLEVRYEDMVNKQEEVSRELVAHCGLEWDDSCLEFYKSDRIVHTASTHQVRKPIYTKSAGRWNNYEKHLGSLKEGLGIIPDVII